MAHKTPQMNKQVLRDDRRTWNWLHVANFSAIWTFNTHCQPLTLWPAGMPGSFTATESMRTSMSCSLPALSPMLSKPSWSSLRLSMCASMSRRSILPKLCRNWSTIRQSEKVAGGKITPGILEISGRGCRGTSFSIVLYIFSFKNTHSWIKSVIWTPMIKCLWIELK